MCDYQSRLEYESVFVYGSQYHLFVKDENVVFYTEERNTKPCMSNICYICGKHYENSYYITEHKKTFHGKSENLPCEVCGEIFVNRRRLKGHKTRNHTDNTYHQCKVIKFCSKLIEASVR